MSSENPAPEAPTVPAPEELTGPSPEEPTVAAPEPLSILLYSSNAATRENVRLALGRRLAADLPPVRVLEVATQPAVITAMDAGGVDLAILDGEAVPGGLGLARQLKDEIVRCPPVLVLLGRPDDAWLATWSRADGAVAHPIDPVRLPAVAASLLRAARPAAPEQPAPERLALTHTAASASH